MINNSAFAEVIESSLQGWLAQSWEWDSFPPFGSLALIESSQRTIMGVVYAIQTGSMDPTRYPFPYKKSEEELRKEQPQIFAFLKTTFSCLTLGFQQKDTLVYGIAPEPPKIHAFVSLASAAVCQKFFLSHHYLYLLFQQSTLIPHIDELIIALFQHNPLFKQDAQHYVESFIPAYSLLIGNDYRRIKLFLQRIEHIIKTF